MNELEHLKSMWVAKVRRKTDLIVPHITYNEQQGSLNNDSWAFKVHYAFRDALDIKYEERKKNKNLYMVWTQGPFLSFKDGDTIHSRDGSRAVQVLSAIPMVWNSAKNEMGEGRVIYLEYSVSDNIFSKLNERTCTQMQFLQLLIYGE